MNTKNIRHNHSFVLDCLSYRSKLQSYDSLHDVNLKGYFCGKKMTKHLMKTGVLNKTGQVKDSEEYKYKCRYLTSEMDTPMFSGPEVVQELKYEKYRKYRVFTPLKEFLKPVSVKIKEIRKVQSRQIVQSQGAYKKPRMNLSYLEKNKNFEQNRSKSANKGIRTLNTEEFQDFLNKMKNSFENKNNQSFEYSQILMNQHKLQKGSSNNDSGIDQANLSQQPIGLQKKSSENVGDQGIQTKQGQQKQQFSGKQAQNSNKIKITKHKIPKIPDTNKSLNAQEYLQILDTFQKKLEDQDENDIKSSVKANKHASNP